MEPLLLYPSKDRLHKGLIAGGVLMVLPALLGLFGLNGVLPFLPTLCMFSFFGGAMLLAKIIIMLQKAPTPVFAADAFGFSLRGGSKIEWSKFKGVDTLPFDTAVKLKAEGLGVLGQAEIKTLELSGPAREMVKQIEDYAALAQRNAMMGGSLGLGGARPGAVTPSTLEEATIVKGTAPAPVSKPMFDSRTSAASVLEPELSAKPEGDGQLLPIELYPPKTKAIYALIFAAVFGLFGLKTLGVEDTEAVYAGWMFVALGAWIAFLAARSMLSNTPSFAADLDGFSVRGKAKRGWDEFRGVKVRTIRYGFFPIAKDVVIKTGKSVLGGRVTINSLHQSGPAADMAAEIADYARRVARQLEQDAVWKQFTATDIKRPSVSQAAPIPEPARPVPAPQPALSFEERLRENGPIASTPRLSERIFGRRKVK